MSKSLFGGGVVLTGALLLSSLMFNVHPSIAENLASSDSTQQPQQKKDATGRGLSGKVFADATAATALEVAQKPEIVEASEFNANPSPLASGKTLTGATLNLSPAAAMQSFTATAYSLPGRTASGANVRRGFIAADHRVFPLGTRVRLEAGSYSGEYLVADRGSAIRGHKIDIWMPSTREAMRFGRRPVRLTVLSYGSRPASRTATTKARR
jgi:3D (Asp-Asp-Asp) domain-containing protein